MIKFKDFLNEEVEFIHTKPAKKEAVLFIGRFQPLTIGHIDLVEQSHKNIGNRKIIFGLIRGSKTPKEKSPFPISLSKKIIESCVKNAQVYEFPTGFIPDIIDEMRGKGYEITTIFCGPDRQKSYEGQIKRYGKLLNTNAKVLTFPRDEKKVSGTKVRQAIKDNDIETFKKLTPKCEHKYFNELRRYV